jgi:hypothetical protein
MMKIDFLKTEHENILRIVDKLNCKINTFGFLIEPIAAKDVRVYLSELFGALKTHIAHEEKALYSEFLKSFDIQTRSIPHSIFIDILEFINVMETFDKKWNIAEIIKSPGDFNIEFNSIAKQLMDRINKEEKIISEVNEKTIVYWQ